MLDIQGARQTIWQFLRVGDIGKSRKGKVAE
jgi:hypothetical protein